MTWNSMLSYFFDPWCINCTHGYHSNSSPDFKCKVEVIFVYKVEAKNIDSEPTDCQDSHFYCNTIGYFFKKLPDFNFYRDHVWETLQCDSKILWDNIYKVLAFRD